MHRSVHSNDTACHSQRWIKGWVTLCKVTKMQIDVNAFIEQMKGAYETHINGNAYLMHVRSNNV